MSKGRIVAEGDTIVMLSVQSATVAPWRRMLPVSGNVTVRVVLESTEQTYGPVVLDQSETTIWPSASSITHRRFSEWAGRMAARAAGWASDTLTLPETVNEPMPEEQVARFIRDMRGMLDAMENASHEQV
ncbi:MAG: hypothetical protein K5Q68_14900 [Roseococcus sp.]|nr:hypothetical protein [Roseococcus sp.]